MARARAVAPLLLLLAAAFSAGLRAAAFAARPGEARVRAARAQRRAQGADRVAETGAAAAVPVEPVLPTPAAKQRFLALATAAFALSLAANGGGFFNEMPPALAETARAVDAQATQALKALAGAAVAGAGLAAWPTVVEPRKSGRDFVLLGTALFLISVVVANSLGIFSTVTGAREGYESATRQLGIILLSSAVPVALLAATSTSPGASTAERSQGVSAVRPFVALQAVFFVSCTANGRGFLGGLSAPDSTAVGAIGACLGVFSALYVLASLSQGVSAWYGGEVADRGLYNNKLFLGLTAFFALSLVASPVLFP